MFAVFLLAHWPLAAAATAEIPHWDGADLLSGLLGTVCVLSLSVGCWFGSKCGHGTGTSSSREAAVQCELVELSHQFSASVPQKHQSTSWSSGVMNFGEIHFTAGGDKYHTHRDCYHLRNCAKVSSRQLCNHCRARWQQQVKTCHRRSLFIQSFCDIWHVLCKNEKSWML